MDLSYINRRYVTTPDNVRLACYYTGKGKDWIILANGLGGPYISWKYIFDYFSPNYKLITWDYRGLYNSSVPEDPNTLSISNHVEDELFIMEQFEIDKAIFVGWSMGCQVNFEFYKRRAEKVKALVVINGTYGKPFGTVLELRRVRYLFPRVIDLVEEYPEIIIKLATRVTEYRSLIKILKYLGLVSSTIDETLFWEVAHRFVNMDVKTYIRIFRLMGEHDAGDILEKISVPTLIIAGQRDKFISTRVAKKMKNRIPNSEILVIPGGTHYTPLEYPEMVVLRMEKFFLEHKLCSQ